MFVLVPSTEEVRRLDLRGWGFYISLGIVKLLFKETEKSFAFLLSRLKCPHQGLGI